MLYRTLKAVIINGDRIEKNVKIELSPDAAARYGDVLEAVNAPVQKKEEEKAPAPEIALEDMELKDLKAKAKELGLSDKGKKSDLIERIKLSIK